MLDDNCDEREASEAKAVRLAYGMGILEHLLTRDSSSLDAEGVRCFPIRVLEGHRSYPNLHRPPTLSPGAAGLFDTPQW